MKGSKLSLHGTSGQPLRKVAILLVALCALGGTRVTPM